MPEAAIKVKNLVKTYGDVRAVDGISFNVRKGEVFAFLGPNGAGKTTTVEVIETIRTPTAGDVEILGYNIRKDRREIIKRIGVLPQEFSSFDRITVRETVAYFRSLFGGGRDIEDLIAMVGLSEEKDKWYMNLSGGLKQRLGIAVALANDPEIVFLDEPTTGLDPRARRETWEVIKTLKGEGKTIFLTTHYMEEAEYLADRVAIISKGKIIAQGSPGELVDELVRTAHITFRHVDGEVKEVAESMSLPYTVLSSGDVVIDVESSDELVRIINEVKKRDINFDGLDVKKGNLEEVFLKLTGESLHEGGNDK
jgi:ABC-2 type transport system ATP-binding protein